MAFRKTDPRQAVLRRPVQVDRDTPRKEDVEVTHARLKAEETLSLDDSDPGGDPYNSTGRFSALPPDRLRRGK